MNSAKQSIIQAFLHLLEGKRFEEVSVKDIVVQAAVSRSTFYLHFHDKFQLLEQVRDLLNGQFLSFYANENHSGQPVTLHLCQHIFNYRSFYKQEFTDTDAAHKLSDQLAAQLAPVFEDTDYAIFASYGTIGFLSFWVMEGFQTSPAEAAEKLLKIGFTNWTEKISGR